MSHFLFSLTLWQLSLVVLGIALGTGLICSVGIRKLFRLSPTDQEADVAIDLMQVASTYIGILLAFAGVLAWQDYKDAVVSIQQEASAASQLYRDLTIYGPETEGVRKDLRVYVVSVVNDEWPLLREGKRSQVTETALLRLFEHVGAIEPVSERQITIYNEVFTAINGLVALRRQRLSASRAEIPTVLWIVALAGSMLTIAYASAFTNSRYSSLMVSGVSLTIGLLFLFLLSVDNPFKGRGEVSSGELAELPAIFDQIDRFR